MSRRRLVAPIATMALALSAMASGQSVQRPGTAPRPSAARSPAPAAPPVRGATFDRLVAEAAAKRQAGELEAAAALYQRAVDHRPAWQEGHWELGALLYQLGRHVEARNVFRRLLRLQHAKPDVPRPTAGLPTGLVHAMKGLCEFQLRHYDTALSDLLDARAAGIDGADLAGSVRYHAAVLMARFESYEHALVTLQPFAFEGNDGPAVVQAFGIATLRMPLLPSELPAERHEMVMLAGRGSYYQAARQPSRARLAFDELARRYPEVPNVQYALGVFLLGEEPDRALDAFRRELKRTPGHVPSIVQIAFEYIKRADWSAARPWAEQAVAFAPTEFAPRRALGQVLIELGDTAAAIEQLERGVRIAPDSPSLRFALSRAYQRANRLADASRERAAFQKLQQLARAQQYGEQSVGGIIDTAAPVRDRRTPQP